MDQSAFIEVIRERRSVRRFDPVPVPLDAIRELVDCARYAPSDTNSQTWEFVAVLNPDRIRRISEITWEKLHGLARDAAARGLDKEARLLVRSFGPYATAFEHAPALMVVLSTPYASKFRDRIFEPLQFISPQTWDMESTKSSCLAAQNLMLAAHAMGLGSCPMTGPVLLAGQSIKEFLGIGPDRQMNMVIALGYPAEKPAAPRRKEVDDILRIIV
ncbi:MAG: nitroreductase family protein [Bacilli bacterium]